MASSTGFYSKDGIPGRRETAEECMICTQPLNAPSTVADGKAVTLKCGHSFHEDCIKGWCLIGQNNSCYYCKDGVDNKTFDQEYWIKTEVMIAPMMRTMKSAISFSVVLILFLVFKFK
jgi:RING finger protein 121